MREAGARWYTLDLSHTATAGDGTFDAQVLTYATGAGPQGVAIADFNRDGALDFAVSNIQSHDLTLRNGKM